MNIKLIYISNNKSNNIELLVEDYEKKINHFISYSSIGLKNKNQKTEKKLIHKSESVLILKNIKSNDLVNLLDEKGNEFSTLDFSKFKKFFTFIIRFDKIHGNVWCRYENN